MGCFPISNCSHEDYTTPVAPNPNPRNFKIVRLEQVGRYIIADVKYPGCNTYEGHKILVFEGVSMSKVINAKVLDPHFCDDGHLSPVARFRPDKYDAAVKFCSND